MAYARRVFGATARRLRSSSNAATATRQAALIAGSALGLDEIARKAVMALCYSAPAGATLHRSAQAM
jgi:hypothetical protein